MGATLAHRGPDDAGLWADRASGVTLAHRRLSIIDPTPDGHQPMVSACGRYVLNFNGEAYNFRSLTETLRSQGVRFRGQSDTEVLLAAMSRWGIHDALQRTDGMFALAVWDRHERELVLARDRIGEKPLYHAWVGETFLFASQLKALLAYPGFSPGIDRSALTSYVRFGYVPGTASIYDGVRKLEPGTLLHVPAEREAPRSARYWDPRETIGRAVRDRFDGDLEEATTEVERLLGRSVARRMISDVPLGAFLSGGIDSSVVVALMQHASAEPVRTFTIGFEESAFDESRHAARIARHLGTDHTELRLTPRECQDIIPSMPQIYDEPFGDSSQIPTTLVARLARQHVTVALAGDGGDELFGGYDRYFVTQSLWRRVGKIPRGLRRALGATARRLPAAVLEPMLGLAGPLISAKMKGRRPASRLDIALRVAALRSQEDLYRESMSQWNDPEAVVVGGLEPPTDVYRNPERWPAGLEPFERMTYFDLMSYLPDDILVKTDRATMSVGLEARLPMLDHELVAFAYSLPSALKIDGDEGKAVLKQVLARHIPPELWRRPKMGFGVPVGAWIRGPLRPWAEDLLDRTRMNQQGYLRSDIVHEHWKQHVSGVNDWSARIWPILMFQAWLTDPASQVCTTPAANRVE